ncbi:hypothetical protein V5799_020993 [Amblyomma americanum]|uniref:Assembly chaperone of rpl4 n=1 Tax=Amblyomma americanum TaxID=6943 RepID=A0AAQ4FUD3_AMBAM
MGRSKRKVNKENKAKPDTKKKPARNVKAECSVDDLLVQMESCINELQYDQARKFGETALKMAPDNLKVLDSLSGLLLEMGDPAGAFELLQKMVQLEPDQGFRNDEDDAEARCAELVQKSIEADPSNPEAFQVQASYLLVKQEHEAAKEAMQRSLGLWLPQHERLLLGDEAGASDPVEVCPLGYSSRVSAAKLLIELEMLDEANTVLDGLVEEDDEVVDVWYLLGWLNYLRGGEYKGNARYYLNQARQVAHKVQFDDAQELAHIEELLAELGPEQEEEGDEDDKGSFATESEEEEDEAMED